MKENMLLEHRKMDKTLKLPVGIENYEEIRRKDYYFVDKTRLIAELLSSPGKANLFTRPIRFGKTLNMSMLRSFFEIGTDMTLFDGTYIAQNEKLCDEHMGRYPVISLTFKNIESTSFDMARNKLVDLIALEAERFDFLSNSERLSETDRKRYKALIKHDGTRFIMEQDVLDSSLRTLSELLYKYYGKKVIILIDEYDVPLDKAYDNGYYSDMVNLIRGLFVETLKSNDSLDFAVLTGCLRVSKESIFTGLNNFRVLSITDERFDDRFGFTEDEVASMLEYYHLESHMEEIREWYDGYRFGSADVYCPWDVINYVDRLTVGGNAEPEAYWINTSGNSLVRRFIDKVDYDTRHDIELLMSGDVITKHLKLELTYNEIENSVNNLWSVLYMTGYLTGKKKSGDEYELCIPNKEVEQVFKTQIQEWFTSSLKENEDDLKALWKALGKNEAERVEKIITKFLDNTINVLDPKGDEKEKEKSYHGFVSGLLGGNSSWGVLSNRESGDGYPDLMIVPRNSDKGLVIELKTASSFAMLEARADAAISQIKTRNYGEYLISEGREDLMLWGISFWKKRCRVKCEKFKWD